MKVSLKDTRLPTIAPTALGLRLTSSNGGTVGTAGSGVVNPVAPPSGEPIASVHEDPRELPVLATVDVLVCGGGPAGTAAAASAARVGAKTLLLEKAGYLGGMASGGYVVPHFNPFLNRGVSAEMVELLNKRQAWGAEAWKISFHPEIWKHASEDLVLDSGADLLYHTYVVAALMDDRDVRGVVVETKSGRFAVLATTVIDCTGDGDVAARAGASFSRGRPEDGQMQPITAMFRLGGVEWVQTKGHQLWDLVQEATAKTGHHFRLPFEYPWAIHLPNPKEVAVQLVHVRNVDATNVYDLTRAEIDARRQTLAVVDFMQNNVPEFSDAYLIDTAPQIGVRESRRITGDYVLNRDDLIDGRMFEDTIATVSFGIDIHDPVGTGQFCTRVGTGNGRAGAYDIPYRCLLPAGVERLLVAGRCISGTFEAHASYRVKGPCMAMGQAAGAAAALAASTGVTPRQVPVQSIHRELRGQGFKLWETTPTALPEEETDPEADVQTNYRRSRTRREQSYHGPG